MKLGRTEEKKNCPFLFRGLFTSSLSKNGPRRHSWLNHWKRAPFLSTYNTEYYAHWLRYNRKVYLIKKKKKEKSEGLCSLIGTKWRSAALYSGRSRRENHRRFDIIKLLYIQPKIANNESRTRLKNTVDRRSVDSSGPFRGADSSIRKLQRYCSLNIDGRTATSPDECSPRERKKKNECNESATAKQRVSLLRVPKIGVSGSVCTLGGCTVGSF